MLEYLDVLMLEYLDVLMLECADLLIFSDLFLIRYFLYRVRQFVLRICAWKDF